jgi:hypothetical protein
MTTADQIRATCNELSDLLVRKGEGYGDKFREPGRMSGQSPVQRILGRMDDKADRIAKMQSAGLHGACGESLRDTIMDMAGYCVLLLILLEDTK